jgi:hypothetical protein
MIKNEEQMNDLREIMNKKIEENRFSRKILVKF